MRVTKAVGVSDMKYSVGTCHEGTDFAVFIAEEDDEQLTLSEAKQLASEHGQGYFLFDCTASEYYREASL